PRSFFSFLQQQGYLRVWIDNEIARVDVDPKKISPESFRGRVQVIQDRITINEANGARLVEALETALRFGKGKINVIPAAIEAGVSPAISRPAAATTVPQLPFSTGWHCAHCDIDIR